MLLGFHNEFNVGPLVLLAKQANVLIRWLRHMSEIPPDYRESWLHSICPFVLDQWNLTPYIVTPIYYAAGSDVISECQLMTLWNQRFSEIGIIRISPH